MLAPRSAGGVSFAARLVALVVVPLIIVSILASQRLGHEGAEASRAAELVEFVDRQQAVAAVIPPAQLEWIALTGLARVDALGIPRTLLRFGTGIDFVAVYSDNRIEFDAALDDLVERHRDYELTDGTLLGERIGAVRGSLDAQRRLSDRSEARSDDIDDVFDGLDRVLEDAVASVRATDPGSVELDRRRVQLDRLADVLISSGEYSRTVLESVVNATSGTAESVFRQSSIHDQRLDLFAESLTFADRTELEAILETSRPDPVVVELSDPADAVARAADPTVLQESTDTVLGQLAYITALKEYSDDFHAGVSAEVLAAAQDADADAARTRIMLWLGAALTMMIMVVVVSTMLAPIRRLTRQAASVGRGEIDQEPLRPRGPRDLRLLTTTMNEMLQTLHRVNDRIRSLSSGESDLPDTDIPGSIGQSLRDSVRHLSNVTHQLKRSEELSSAIVAQAADAIWTVDQSGAIRTANQASGVLTRVPPEQQIGEPIGRFLSQTSGEANVSVPAGQRPRVLVTTSAIDVDGDRITAVIAHDISDRSRFEERLAYQANHDALTGLPNRFAVLQHLEDVSVADGEDVGVLFVDLDGFKSVNDVQGHAVGDRVLVEVASRLRGAVRDGELVARLGGDEFVVVSRRFAQVADVVALGHRIIREIEQPYDVGDQVFVLSASVGVTLPKPGTAALDTIRQADNALYQAKRRGRSRVEMFDATMQENIDRQAELELALRNAVRSDELVVHVQPVADLATGTFTGGEALVRWERPGHGLVPPGDFIPVAERSSLIFEIERWVLVQVCEMVARWRLRDPGCRYRIAINVSGRHLIEGDLLSDVDAALLLTGADPSMLEFELTETQLLEDLDRATTALNDLRRRGITIALDDFGTGYSSMTYLRNLPIDSVKIDRSFVARATDHGYDSTVIEALLTIGRTLDLSVVAEGVETVDQLDYVRARGVQRAQGFLLARPVPVPEAEAMIFSNERLFPSLDDRPSPHPAQRSMSVASPRARVMPAGGVRSAPMALGERPAAPQPAMETRVT